MTTPEATGNPKVNVFKSITVFSDDLCLEIRGNGVIKIESFEHDFDPIYITLTFEQLAEIGKFCATASKGRCDGL